MTGAAVGEHLAVGDVERGKEISGAVAFVVVRHGTGPAGAQGQTGLGSIQRLALGLLVEAEQHRALWRIHVQADDVDQLLFEVRVVGDLEGVDSPRLEVVVRPDSGHSILADAEPASE